MASAPPNLPPCGPNWKSSTAFAARSKSRLWPAPSSSARRSIAEPLRLFAKPRKSHFVTKSFSRKRNSGSRGTYPMQDLEIWGEKKEPEYFAPALWPCLFADLLVPQVHLLRHQCRRRACVEQQSSRGNDISAGQTADAGHVHHRVVVRFKFRGGEYVHLNRTDPRVAEERRQRAQREHRRRPRSVYRRDRSRHLGAHQFHLVRRNGDIRWRSSGHQARGMHAHGLSNHHVADAPEVQPRRQRQSIRVDGKSRP